jgi:hypothetical protein
MKCIGDPSLEVIAVTELMQMQGDSHGVVRIRQSSNEWMMNYVHHSGGRSSELTA